MSILKGLFFFVKPEFCEMSEHRLKASAHELIKNATPPPYKKSAADKYHRLRQALRFFLAATAGAALSAAGLIIFLG